MRGSTFTSRLAPPLVLVLALLTVAAIPGFANTLSVPQDAPTIGEAMQKARSGDIILISCGTYHESDIPVKPGVTLWSGTLQPACVTIDARGQGPIFIFADADTSTALVGLTLTGGRADRGGAIQIRSGSPRLTSCIFTGNEATRGGAIEAQAGSRPVLRNCLFRGNNARQSGGAILAAGVLDLQECAFKDNSALMGGALHLEPGARLLVAGSTFVDNVAGNTGGAIHGGSIHDDAIRFGRTRANIRHTVFAGNQGGLGGAAISLAGSQLQLASCTLVGQEADEGGAVLAIQGQAPTIVNTIIAFNTAAILRTDGEVPTFRGCNLWGNRQGDWTDQLRPLANRESNISCNPRFCAPERGDYRLTSTSCCLPAHNPAGNKGLVGAWGLGCGANASAGEREETGDLGFRAILMPPHEP